MKSIPVHLLSSPFPDSILSIFLLSMETFSNQFFKSNNIKEKKKLSCLSFYYHRQKQKNETEKKYVSQIFNFYAAVRETNLRRLSNSHKRKNISEIKSNGRQEVPWGDMVEKGRNIERWNLLMCQEMYNVVVMLEKSKICLENSTTTTISFLLVMLRL